MTLIAVTLLAIADQLFLRCRHSHRFYARGADGVMRLVCDRCGDAREALARSNDERTRATTLHRRLAAQDRSVAPLAGVRCQE